MTVTMEHMRAVLYPKGIAVVGATEREGSVGRTVVENLQAGLKQKANAYELYPVNPTRKEVLGLPCYPSVSAINTGNCEHVVVITPAARCPEVLRDVVKNKSVKVVVVLAAGFKEVGEEGLKLELELVEIAKAAGVCIVGPNCLGVQSPNHHMNATFAADPALPGNVAFVSQSGAMCTAVLDWSLEAGVGFSAFISIGSMSHVEWSHLIEFLGDDDATKAILVYMETIGDAAAFMKAARKVSAKKPIVVLKAGKTEAAAAAAVSHTGSLAGSHDAFLAAMSRAGCLVVDDIDDLQHIALLTSMQPRPTGDGLIIVTNAGGPGVLSTDAAAMAGLQVVDVPEPLVQYCDTFLPAAWSRHNPMDLLGDAKAPAYGKVVEALFEKGPAGCSGLIVLSPQSVTEPEATAEAVAAAVKKMRGANTAFDGPIVCSWMGGKAVGSSRKILMDHGIPSFNQPDIAARCLAHLWKQVAGANSITPIPSSTNPQGKAKALAVMEKAKKESRSILTESESKEIMKAYGIDVAESIVCQSVEEAIAAAKQVQYPCVIKLNSETITHKSDVGGVKLNIRDEAGVRKAWTDIKTNVDKIGPNHFQGVSVQPMLDIASGVELLIGSSPDNQFGPMVLFGTGGCFVEVFRDAAMAVPPLDRAEAKRLIGATKISKALVPGHGERFKGCPVEDVESTLEKFSVLMCDLYEHISECEINPLLALEKRVIALDARVVLNTDASKEVAHPCLVGERK